MSSVSTSPPVWTNRPYVIHLNADPGADIQAARACGAQVRTMRLEGLRDLDALDVYATGLFEIPHPPGGIDSMASWLTDLYWLDTDAGVLFVIDVEGARRKVETAMLSMLPFIVAWWQLWPQQTAAHVINVEDVSTTVSMLERENDRIEGRPMATATPPATRIPILVGE